MWYLLQNRGTGLNYDGTVHDAKHGTPNLSNATKNG